MIPRIGEPVLHDKTYIHRPGAYAILVRNGHVLLTLQDNLKEPEVQLPGGGVDPGENPVPALHREILEETGWRAKGLKRLGAFRRFTYMEDYGFWAEKVCQIYLGQPTIRVSDPTEPAHTPLWVVPEMAIEMVENDGDRLFLMKLFR